MRSTLPKRLPVCAVFEDQDGKMNRSVQDVGGSVLAVSQFTLYGDVRRGKRPSFDAAAPPEPARQLYEFFVERIRPPDCAAKPANFRKRCRSNWSTKAQSRSCWIPEELLRNSFPVPKRRNARFIVKPCTKMENATTAKLTVMTDAL